MNAMNLLNDVNKTENERNDLLNDVNKTDLNDVNKTENDAMIYGMM